MALDCFQSVLRAGRVEPARRGKRRGNEALVAPNHEGQGTGDGRTAKLHWLMPRRPRTRRGGRSAGCQTMRHRRRDGAGSPRPRQGLVPETRAAKDPGADAVNDCGPPRYAGTGVRSVPCAGGPFRRLSKKCRGALGECDGRSRALGVNQFREPAGASAESARRRSDGGVLRADGNGQPLPPLLAAARQDCPTPAVGHPGPESVFGDTALVARSIRRHHGKTLPEIKPSNVPSRGVWGKV